MLSFISFGIKIILAAIIGGAFSYSPKGNEKKEEILDTSLICIMSASVMSITKQLAFSKDYYLMGFAILSLTSIVLYISKNLTLADRINWVFVSIIGIIIGVGYFLQAIILTLLIYYILNNKEDVLDFMYKNDEINDGIIKDSIDLDSEIKNKIK